MTGWRRGWASDSGMTLLEIICTMAIMSVVMAMVTAGLVSFLRADRSTTALVDTQTRWGRVFGRLDKELRYAEDVAVVPLAGSGSTYPSLVYLTTVTSARCAALSLAGGQLRYQQWPPGSGRGPVTVLATGVTVIAGQAPFSMTAGPTAAPGGTSPPAQPKGATIALLATSGGPAASSHRELRETFLAPNTLQGPHGAAISDCTT
jgi:prepilin-type N-terminal cleavage/methylation domain-containing protein